MSCCRAERVTIVPVRQGTTIALGLLLLAILVAAAIQFVLIAKP